MNRQPAVKIRLWHPFAQLNSASPAAKIQSRQLRPSTRPQHLRKRHEKICVCIYYPTLPTLYSYMVYVCAPCLSYATQSQRDTVILSPKTVPNSQSYPSDDLSDLSKSMTLPGFDITDDPKEKGLEHPAFDLLDRYSSVILNHQTEADKSSTSAITINQTAVLIFYVSREVWACCQWRQGGSCLLHHDGFLRCESTRPVLL